MSNPFDYVESIMQTKTNMMRNTENDTLTEAGYNPWLSNVALSYHEDTILAANLTNLHHQLPKRAQYEVLLAVVRAKKRQRRKWIKPEVDENLNIVCQHYKCSKRVGEQYMNLLTTEQLELLKKQQQTGGTK